jgi:hypothetical protein
VFAWHTSAPDNLWPHPITLRIQYSSEQCPLAITDTVEKIKDYDGFLPLCKLICLFPVLCQLMLLQSLSTVKAMHLHK